MSRPGFNGSRPGGLRKSTLSPEEQTIQEWNERMNRLNSNLASIGEMPIQNISGNSYAGGGMGFAGMYQYTGSRNSSNLSSLVTSFNKMQPTRFERWATSKTNTPNAATNLEKLSISPSVIKEIQECFARADSKSQDGYLDVEELKGFMACRNYPITHWEAKKLLKNADPAYEKFISLDQIMFLVFHCGLTTPQEKPSDSIEFQNSLRELANVGIPRTEDQNFHATLPQRGNNRHSLPQNYGGNSFSPHPQSFYPNSNSQSQSYFPMNYRRLIQPDKDSILTENIEMENARTLFEQMAMQEKKKKIHETQYKAYREGLRNGSVVKESSTPKSSGFGYNNFNMPQEYYEPTKWDPHPQVVEPESGYEDVNAELNLDYSSVKANWEEQLSRAREAQEGDTWKQIQKQKSQLKSRDLNPDETQAVSTNDTEIEGVNEEENREDNTKVGKIPAALFKSLEINQLRADLKETNNKTNKQFGSKIKEAPPQPQSSQEDEFLNNFQAIKGAVGNQLARIFSERRPIPCPAMKGACSKDSLNKPEKREIEAKSKSVKQNYIMNTDEREAIKKSGILHSLELDKESSNTDILFKSKISQSASKQEI